MKSFDPSGKVFIGFPDLVIDDLPGDTVHSKQGRRLSAATVSALKEIKSCRDRIKGCHEQMKGFMDELDEMVTKLMGEDEPEEPDDVLDLDD